MDSEEFYYPFNPDKYEPKVKGYLDIPVVSGGYLDCKEWVTTIKDRKHKEKCQTNITLGMAWSHKEEDRQTRIDKDMRKRFVKREAKHRKNCKNSAIARAEERAIRNGTHAYRIIYTEKGPDAKELVPIIRNKYYEYDSDDFEGKSEERETTPIPPCESMFNTEFNA